VTPVADGYGKTRVSAAALWRRCDTVLLDMDGTLLDLSFDNWFWREAVPRCVARSRGDAGSGEIRSHLFESYSRKRGSLEWYCLDYWTAQLGVDLRVLKAASSHRIRYLPGARAFLRQAAASGKRLVLVTDAHADTLAVKAGVSGFAGFFDACLSSHEFGAPKASPEFWQCLHERLGFDRQHTLFVDDSLPVLDAARAFGIAAVVAVTRPDTLQPARAIAGHHTIDGVMRLLE
jgi:putative hydrolase of the HAD superfamily